MKAQRPDRDLDSAVAWRRARCSLRRLFDDPADLKEVGGAESVADSEDWPEGRVARAVGEMNLVRRMLRDEVIRLQGEPAGCDGGYGWS